MTLSSRSARALTVENFQQARRSSLGISAGRLSGRTLKTTCAVRVIYFSFYFVCMGEWRESVCMDVWRESVCMERSHAPCR